MNSIKTLCAAFLLSATIGVPAYAQMATDSSMQKGGAMSTDSNMKMKMSMKEKKMMTKCSGMSHDMMMKDEGCMKMMKTHPDMMKGG